MDSEGHGSSCWVIAAQSEEFLLGLASNPKWKKLETAENIELLTDALVGYKPFAVATSAK